MSTHKEKQRIFDRHAESMGFDDWDHLANDFECNLMTIYEFQLFMFEACDLVQEEQQKIIAENAKMKFHDGHNKVDSPITYFQDGANNIHIDKASITNPENKIQ